MTVPRSVQEMFASIALNPPSGIAGVSAPLTPVPLTNLWLQGKRVFLAENEVGADAVIKALSERIAKHSVAVPLRICVDVETAACAHVVTDYQRACAEHAVIKARFDAFPKLKQCPPDQITARENAQREMEAHREAVLHPAAAILKKAGLRLYDGQVRLIQIYTGHDTVAVIDRWKVPADRLQQIYDLLMSPHVVWIGHNIQFDVRMLSQHGCTPARAPHCTLLLHQAMTSLTYIRRTLKALCETILQKGVAKDLQMSDWSSPILTQDQLEYAAGDVVATWELFNALHYKAQLATGKLSPIANPLRVYDLMRGAIRATNEIMLSGMGFDADAHHAMANGLKSDYDQALAAVLAEFIAIGGTHPHLPVVSNPGSNQQVSAWIEAVKVGDTWPRTITGQLMVGKNDLKANLVSIPLEFRGPINALIQWARSKKDYSNFGHDYSRHVNKISGRIHANFRIGGAETGRFSVTDPALQTINRASGFRKLFKAYKGCVYIARDYGQIEMRVGACLSGDRVLLGAITDGLDIHTLTALACFHHHPNMLQIATELGVTGIIDDPFAMIKLPEFTDFVKKGDGAWMRQSSKNALFGLIFGQGPGGLQALMRINGVNLTTDECKVIQTKLLELFPEFRQWIIDTRAAADRSGVVWTKYGRVYSLPPQGSLYTKSINTPCQGGAAEIMLYTLCHFPQAWDTYGLKGKARLVHVVHDELVAEADPVFAPAVAAAMEEIMIKSATTLYPNMPLTGLVGGGIGETWADAK